MYIGAHIALKKDKLNRSNGKEILNGLKQLTKMDGNAMQLFTRVPYKASKESPYPISTSELSQIKSYASKHDILLSIHAPYILDFCKKPPPSQRNMWAVQLLIDDLHLADQIGAVGVVIHMGRKTNDQTIQEAYKNMIISIEHALSQVKGKAKVILETSSGEGTKIASTLQTFAKLYHAFSEKYKKRIGLCVDTCHIFVAGHPIHSVKGIKSYFDQFDKLIGLKNLTLIHLNDSKSEHNSHSDRHAPLLQGHIFNEKLGGDPDALTYLLRVAKKSKIPLILETHADYKKEIKSIKLLIQQDNIILNNTNKKRITSQKGGATTKTIISIFKQLKEYYQSTGNLFKANAYQKAITTLSSLKKPIKSTSNVKQLPGIGKSFIEKIDEILKTDRLKQLNSLKTDPKVEALKELTSILGIGPTTAKSLINQHKIYSIKQLKKAPKKLLTSKQQIGLKYYSHLQKRISRSEITKFIKKVKTVLPSHYILEPAGSYRQEAKTSGDIDLIISSKQYKTKSSVIKADPLSKIIQLLYKHNLLLETINQGYYKFMGITIDKHHIDIRFAPYDSLITTIVYFSRGEEESRNLRQTAKQLGYKLNEWGLYKGTSKIPINSEKQLIQMLKI
jgi:apurinic endonuclease APN1